MKNIKGFTIIELVITSVVIVLLMGIVTVSYINVQKGSRDNIREGSVKIIANALEKYYEKHGEYPSVRSLANNFSENTGMVVASKLKISASDLKMPKLTEGITNPITSTAPPTNDLIAYIASSDFNNTNCQTVATAGCDQFTLTYKKENNETVSVESLHKGRGVGEVPTPGGVAKPTVNAALAGSDVAATASAGDCTPITLTKRFSFRHRIDSGTWSAYSAWGTNETYTVAGSPARVYDFQAIVRCDDDTTPGALSPESDIASFTYPPSAPSTPTVAVAQSGNNVVATTSLVTCSNGSSPQYAFRSWANIGSAWSSWTAWSTDTISSQPGAPGVRYGYQVQARCIKGSSASNAVTSAEATFIYPIPAPEQPTLSYVVEDPESGYVIWTFSGVNCPAGTSAEYSVLSTIDWGYSSTFTTKSQSVAWYVNYEGYQYTKSVQSRCFNSNVAGPWSPVSADSSYVRPITPPGDATNFQATIASDRMSITWTWAHPVCAPYTRAEHRRTNLTTVTDPNTWYPWNDRGYWLPERTHGVMNFSTGQQVPIKKGDVFRVKTQYACVNWQTGRASDWGPVTESQIHTAP